MSPLKHLQKVSISLLLSGLISMSAFAQTPEISLGPQLGAMGVGGSASFGFTDYLSLSAELGFFKLTDITIDADDEELTSSVDISGALVGVNFHPFKGRFSLGIGFMKAKYAADAESEQLTGTVEIGNTDYPAQAVGSLIGEIELSGTWPAIILGWRGSGFNFGLGVAIADAPNVDLRATGPVSVDPQFQAELDKELDQIRADLDIGLIPIVRIAYQFKIKS